jgi:HPt (histidine-containing phosphotransfer) domain-containing protein
LVQQTQTIDSAGPAGPDSDDREIVLDQAALTLLRELDRDGSGRILKLAIEKFLAYGSDAFGAMRHAVARGDGAELHRHVHSMKSSSASLGATALSEQCQEIESRIRNDRLPGDIMPALVRLERRFRSTERALRAVQRG